MQSNLELRQKENKWLLRYSLMYAMLAVGLIVSFLLINRSTVYVGDGLHQHYTAMQYIKDTVHGIITGKGIKMVDFSLGQGLDVLGTLPYYGLCDPVNLIAVFFADINMETAYMLAIFIRFYLAGLFFGFYCRAIGIEEGWAISIGAIAFAFCGMNLYSGFKHPYFLDGSIYLALVLCGIERSIRKRGWLMYPITVALMLIANYYFAYKTTIILIAYILVRLLCNLKERGINASAGLGFKLLGGYILGALLSAVVLFPVCIAFLRNGRIGAEAGYTASMLHYPLSYYIKMIALFVVPNTSPGYWTVLGFTPLALFCVVSLFIPKRRGNNLVQSEKKTDTELRIGFILALIALCVPFMGKVFNGFGYVCNRWCYGFSFITMVILVKKLPEMLEKRARTRIISVLALCFGVILCIAAVVMGNKLLLIGGACLTVVAICFIINTLLHIHKKATVRLLCAGFTLCMMVYQVYFAIPSMHTVEHLDRGIYSVLMNETANAAGKIDDEGFYRVDTGLMADTHSSMFGYNGLAYYWSVIPAETSGYYANLRAGALAKTYCLDGIGGNTILTAVASTKYAVRDYEYPVVLPYGYEKIYTDYLDNGKPVDVYQNEYALPIGYLFTEKMSNETYNALTPIEKQEALIAYAITDKQQTGDDFRFETEEIPFEIISCENAIVYEDRIEAKAGGKIEISISGKPDSETFIGLENTKVKTNVNNASIYVQNECGNTRLIFINPMCNFAYDQKGAIASIGYSKEGTKQCTLVFNHDCIIKYDDMSVYSMPMSYYRDKISRLQKNAVENVNAANNYIQCDINAQEDGILQMSIPYSKGWTAYVDGKEAETFVCGGMYTGIDLKAGYHNIEMRYETPGLRIGLYTTIMAAVVSVSLCFYLMKKNRVQ
ncbi:MAG: YfhO family protein [Clostridia bacterium]|nr:YfhO family protein [Clostridia bacterium]